MGSGRSGFVAVLLREEFGIPLGDDLYRSIGGQESKGLAQEDFLFDLAQSVVFLEVLQEFFARHLVARGHGGELRLELLARDLDAFLFGDAGEDERALEPFAGRLAGVGNDVLLVGLDLVVANARAPGSA